MKKFELLKKEIEEKQKKAPYKIEYGHAQSVLNWVLKLKPTSRITLKIAALGHDMDRSVPERRIKPDNFKDYKEYKKAHSKRSAEIIVEMMQKFDFHKGDIEETKTLIENHEVGGKGDVEILKDADSLSFFENNLEHYQEKNPKYVKDKIKFMYKRLSNKAKKMIPNLEFQNKKLEELVKQVISKI